MAQTLIEELREWARVTGRQIPQLKKPLTDAADRIYDLERQNNNLQKANNAYLIRARVAEAKVQGDNL
jgi:hypothetical protein